MNEQEAVKLMKSSNTEAEWNDNCNKVKAACGGYPTFWYSAILQSGVAERTLAIDRQKIDVLDNGKYHRFLNVIRRHVKSRCTNCPGKLKGFPWNTGMKVEYRPVLPASPLRAGCPSAASQPHQY